MSTQNERPVSTLDVRAGDRPPSVDLRSMPDANLANLRDDLLQQAHALAMETLGALADGNRPYDVATVGRRAHSLGALAAEIQAVATELIRRVAVAKGLVSR